MPNADEFLTSDDSNPNHEISPVPPTVAAMLGNNGREAQRAAWDRARAVAVDLQVTLPTIAELREQEFRAGPFTPPQRDERRESRDEYKRRCDRERDARPKENHGDTSLVVVRDADGRRVELDADAGAIVADMGDE